MKLNKLSLNYTKAKFMIFRPNLKNNPYKFKIQIGNHVLQQADQIKYLGVPFDGKFIFNTFVTDSLVRTGAQRIF